MKPKPKDAPKGSEKRSRIHTMVTPTPQTIGAKPFAGKVFYLDLASNRVAETLESDIKDLGGVVEKFFSKEIKYLISNKREAKYVQCLRQDSPIPSPDSGPSSPQACSSPHQPQSRGDSTKSKSLIQKNIVAASRGRSLVKRVVKEQEKIHVNKILSNALDWGVKILYLDDVIAYVQKKKKTFCCHKPATPVKTNIKCDATKRLKKIRGGRISKPFVKVEDWSRHYQPFYISLTNIPEFNLATLPPCTPFCAEEKGTLGNRGLRASTSDKKQNNRKKKKNGGYCECCLIKYDNVTTHLQSDRHKSFAISDEYRVVDKVVSSMQYSFTHIHSKLKRQKCSVSSIAPGLNADNPKHKATLDSVENLKMPQSPFNKESKNGECKSELNSKLSFSAAPVVCRTNNRQKPCTFTDSKLKPMLPSYQDQIVDNEQDPVSNGQLAPPTGESAAARLGEAPDMDHGVPECNRLGDSSAVKGHMKAPPESLTETKLSKLMLLLRDTSHNGSLIHKQMTDSCLLQTHNSSEDFVPVERVRRKVKVYKRKRRKVPSSVVSELVEPEDAADDGLRRLRELFEASDEMDLEFYGF